MSQGIKNEIAKMFELARLEIAGADAETYINRAGHVIDYFKKLENLDTSNVDPLSHAIQTSSLLREDVVVNFADAVKIIGEAPEVEKLFIEVPKVI